jgi:HlyD family secretion protein
VAAIEAQLKAAQAALAVSRKEVPLIVQTAEATVVLARSQLTTARASEKQAGRDASHFNRLVEAGTVDRRRYEQMELACQVARIARHHHHIHAFNSIRLIGEEMVY